MTLLSVVCVILIRSLVVAASPTCDNGVPVLIELPVSGVTKISGTVPVSGSTTIVGHTPLESTSPNLYIQSLPSENNEASKFTEFDETSPLKFQDNDEMNSIDPIPKKVILGAILADSFMAEKGSEIDAKLAEFETFVNKELETVGPILHTALVNADTSEIDSSVDSTLLEMESQISSKLNILDECIQSELAKTEELVESVIRNVETYTANNAEKNPRIKLDLAMLESFVESTLEKSEALVESELEKVNSLVESELANVDFVLEPKLHNVDLFIEREMAKTDAVVKSELSRMESIVEKEMSKVEKSMEDNAHPITASSDLCTIYNSNGNYKKQTNEDQVRTVAIDGTFPVTGRTAIIGSTGYISPFSTGKPLPLYVESFPIFDDQSCNYLRPSINCNISPPTVGRANPKIPLKQAGPYNRQYFTISQNNKPSSVTDYVLYHKKQLPRVTLRNFLINGQKPDGVVLKGDVEFSGKAEAFGSARLSADFPCPTLTASEEGPDGKKYIWISKKQRN